MADGVSEQEVIARLQARVPEFKLSPDPGGQWDWLLGLAALGISTTLLVALSRRAVRRLPKRPLTEVAEEAEDDDLADRLDDELLATDC